MQIVYFILFSILVLEVLVLLLLTIPTPRGWKGAITKFITTSPKMGTVMKVLILFCVIAGIFLADSMKSEARFRDEKAQLKDKGDHIGSEIRRGWLSYTILKVQRNQYICSMLIYSSIGLFLYVTLLNYTYRKRENFQKSLELKQKPDSVKKVSSNQQSTLISSKVKKNQ